MILKRIRVLYVDDSRLDRELVRDALSHGETTYELTEAATAEEFEAALHAATFDVVLTDFNICGFEGLQVLARVRELFPDVPVILVTGTGSEEIAVEAMKNGAADYIIKSSRSITRLPASIEGAIRSRRLTDEKARAEEALRESEARFRHAVVKAPFPVMIHAEDGEILAVSDVWFELTGYRPNDLTSTRKWAELAYGEYSAETLEGIALTYQGTEPIDEGQFAVRCADGSERIWMFRSTPVGTLANGRRCAISMASDMTDYRAMESQLRQSQKLAAIGRLAGGVAHDFNNMLQVILGYGSIAIDSLDSSTVLSGWLTMIMEAANRSANLTRQLLAFVRTQPLEPKRVDPGEALTGMVKLLSRIVEEDVVLVCDVSSDIWSLEIDPAQLDSIVANLVINARDAIVGAGRIEVEATNRPMSSGDYVAITVRDTGTGIVSEQLGRVFEPFFTTKERGTGNGLGLATVSDIVRNSGGSITVESESGMGTMFTVLLPRYKAPLPADSPVPHQKTAPAGSRRILLVEDDEAVLRITEQLLIELGYKVTATGDPFHALELVRQDIGTVDLVMTDVVMPGLDGPTLVQQVRSILPTVPVLFTSGYPAGIVNDHGVVDDDIHFLPKPFSREQLARKVAEADQPGEPT
jgi:PAS domain S-box-containing protein